ncbi:MAG: sugar phosphate isomerase/epimerase [Defluviitaleaceae bacterium]|nr:sugar phosphate isomerase/epimerase [Defluviitaleaceae bacterium]
MAKSNVDLMCTYWTTAGLVPGEGDISRFSFKDRVEAMSKAGFKGIGFWHTDLEHIMSQMPLSEIKKILDANGMEHIQLEFLTDWFLTGQKKAESDKLKKRLFEASAALNASHVKVGDFYETSCSMDQAVESWAALCKDAEAYGATIGFEFMLNSMINTVPEALQMVQQAGAKNGGLIVDIIHVNLINTFGKSHKTTNEELSQIPLENLICVEINDAALESSPLYDPERERRWLGEGDFDVTGFIDAFQKAGYNGPWALEIYSKDLACLPLQEVCDRAYNTTIPYFK